MLRSGRGVEFGPIEFLFQQEVGVVADLAPAAEVEHLVPRGDDGVQPGCVRG